MKSIYNILIVLCLLSCDPTDYPRFERQNNVQDWSEIDQSFLSGINEYRHTLGLNDLTPNKDLQDEAIKRLKYIDSTGTFSHKGMSYALNNLKAKDYEYVTELLAFGYGTPTDAIEAFNRSESHSEQITSNRHAYIGAHCFKNTYGRYYYILLFSK